MRHDFHFFTPQPPRHEVPENHQASLSKQQRGGLTQYILKKMEEGVLLTKGLPFQKLGFV